MKTQKQLLTEHRQGLDEKFIRDYPMGKFCIQYRGDMGLLARGNDYWALHWCPKRSTGATKYRGISTYFKRNNNGRAISQENYQNCCFGKCYNYATVELFLRACRKKQVPTELIKAFMDRYQIRASEGFAK